MSQVKKIVLEGDQKIFFTSDTHYSHANICRGTTNWDLDDPGLRNFVSLEEMNAEIVNGINEKVGQDDWLIHLGDWSFGGFDQIEQFRRRIVCKNVILILGNHDHHIERNKHNVQSLFHSVHSYLELTVSSSKTGKRTYNCFHFPIRIWNKAHKGRMHLYGHVHNNYTSPGRALDVGMDSAFDKLGWYFPFSQEDIDRYMKNRTYQQLDHHDENTN